MNSSLNSNFQLKHGRFARALSLLLLTFVFYGITVEAAHRHGRVSFPDSAASVTDVQTEGQDFSSVNGCSDCLICQLHQSFSTAALSGRVETNSLSLRIRSTSAETIFRHAVYSTPQRGRAPPVIS